MTASNDVLVSDAPAEDKFVTIWPDYPCLYDVVSVDFRNRGLRHQAMEAIREQLDHTYFENVMQYRPIIHLPRLSVRHVSDGIA